jgi:glycosyl transferase family 25
MTKPPIFVINLDRSIERMRLFEYEAKRVGLPFLRWSATDGTTTDRSNSHIYDSDTILKAHGSHLTGGELGCYLSHIRLWQTALTRTMKWILVLEDDATIDTRLLSVLDNINRLPDDWEVLILQRASAKKPFSRHRFLPDLDVARHFHIGYFATGYLIHRRALERLEDHLLPVRWPIDHWDRWWAIYGLVVYRVDADLVVQNEALESTMQRDLDNKRLEQPATVQFLLMRRYWRSKLKLFRLYRLGRTVIENILRQRFEVRLGFRK